MEKHKGGKTETGDACLSRFFRLSAPLVGLTLKARHKLVDILKMSTMSRYYMG